MPPRACLALTLCLLPVSAPAQTSLQDFEVPRGMLGQTDFGQATAQIAAGGTDIWQITLQGNPGEVALRHEDAGRLVLTITDSTGAEVCRDDSGAEILYCSWPDPVGDHVATVSNPGAVTARYMILWR